MRKKKEPSTEWRTTPAGNGAYIVARNEAQKRANDTGFDYGLEPSDMFQEYRIFMLPMKGNRSGHELRCEVVMCEDLNKCQKGHGPRS